MKKRIIVTVEEGMVVRVEGVPVGCVVEVWDAASKNHQIAIYTHPHEKEQ